jgi:hypothetical protein
MNTLKSLFFGTLLIASISPMAQTKTVENFNKRVKMAQLILEKQPKATQIKSLLTEGFTLDSANAVGYYIKCPDNIQMVATLYKDTERTVALWFYEKNEAQKEIYDYAEKALKFVYFGSEHMCDYYNNEVLSLRFSPKMDLGLLVYIEPKY